MVQILDASVVLKWFFEEEGSELAMRYLEQVLNQPRNFAIPELLFYELQNILFRIKLNSEQKKLFESALRLGWKRFPCTAELSRLTAEYQALGLSGYDASYCALAKFLNGVWITADQKAFQKVRHTRLAKLL